VPEGVVDLLEVVQVEQQHRQARHTGWPGDGVRVQHRRQQLLQAFGERQPVRQPGQRVGAGGVDLLGVAAGTVQRPGGGRDESVQHQLLRHAQRRRPREAQPQLAQDLGRLGRPEKQRHAQHSWVAGVRRATGDVLGGLAALVGVGPVPGAGPGQQDQLCAVDGEQRRGPVEDLAGRPDGVELLQSFRGLPQPGERVGGGVQQQPASVAANDPGQHDWDGKYRRPLPGRHPGQHRQAQQQVHHQTEAGGRGVGPQGGQHPAAGGRRDDPVQQQLVQHCCRHHSGHQRDHDAGRPPARWCQELQDGERRDAGPHRQGGVHQPLRR